MPRLQLPRPPERKPLPRPTSRPLRSSKGSLPRPPSSTSRAPQSRTSLPTPPQRLTPQQQPTTTPTAEAEWQTLQTADGTPYYLHVPTQKTVWERPAELVPEETTKEEDLVVEEPAVTSDPAPIEPATAALGATMGGDAPPTTTKPQAVVVPTETTTDTDDDPLPPGWNACWDDNAQSYYYVNDADQSTTWDRPTLATAPPLAFASSSTPPLTVTAAEETTPPETAVVVTPEASSPLPEGWTELVTDEGVPYYICDADGSSTWERPTTTVKPIMPVDAAAEEMPPEETVEAEPTGATPSAATSPSDAALPPGWVELYNDEGIPYYLYEPDQSVTWDRPVAPALEETQVAAVADDLPPEAVAPPAMDQDQSSSKDEPEVVSSSNPFPDTLLDQGMADDSAPPVEPVETDVPAQSADLPPGWQEMQDSDGNVYYYNTIDDSTTWEKPVIVPTDTESEEVVAAEIPDTTTAAAAGDLPPEWQELQDEEGNIYYHNTVDGSTSWERPAVATEQQEEHVAPEVETIEGPVDVPTAAETELAACLPQEEPVPEEQHITEDLAAQTPVSDLPPGWQEVQDENGNTYYYSTVDRTTTWDKPATPNDGTSAPPNPETSLDESMLPDLAAQEQAMAIVPEAEVAVGLVAEASPLDGPAPESAEDEVAANPELSTGFLLPGWQELQDDQGMVYYHNLVDGTTTWAKPIAEEESASVTEAEVHPDDLPPAYDQANPSTDDARATTEQEPESNDTATTPTDLPPNWEEVQMDDGTVYYFNTVDQSSSWERPVVDSSAGPAAEDTPESLPKEESATAPELSSKQVVDSASDPEVLPLPEGWIEDVTDDGVPYYINNKTRESVWERPAASSLNTSSPPNSGDQQHAVDGTQQASPKSDDFSYEEVDPMPSTEPLRDGWVDDMDPNEPAAQDELPPGWKELHDMDTDSTYYLNELDGSTQWERPIRTDAAKSVTTRGETQVVPEETGKEAIDEGWTTPYAVPSLAEGWTEHVDPSSGNPYFYNEATGETRHERPHPSGTLDTKPTNLGYEHELPPRNATFPAIVSFGFGGKICIVRPQAKPVVKIYRTHHLVPHEPICQLAASKTASGIPGPLAKVPDDVVSQYIDCKAGYEDSQLLWSLVSIAIKCRGRLRSLGDTSDSVRPQPMIAKLLVKDYATQSTQEAEPDLNESSRESLIRVEQLLVEGKREEAVEHAVESGNFPMAILIASMLGRDALMKAVNGYIEKAHFTGKPLHALALLFSGLLKPSSGGTGSYWDEINPETLKATWKYHLAGMLNNTVEKWEHLVVALGTRLAQIDPDNVIAAHVCYLVCGCAVGRPSTGAPILLLGSNSTLADLARCSQSAIDSFQLTEAYEWAKRRGNYNASIRSLQVYKVVLAHQLCDFGFVEASRLYLESVIEHLGWTIHDAQSLPQAQMLLSCGSEDVANEELVSLAANLFCRLTGAVPTERPSKPAPEESTDVNASFMTAHTHFHDEDAAIPSDDFVAGPDRTESPFSGHDQNQPTKAREVPFEGIPQGLPSGLGSQPATFPPGEPSFSGQTKPPAVDTAPQTTDDAPLITPGIAQAKPETAPSSAPANLQPSKSAKNSSAKRK